MDAFLQRETKGFVREGFSHKGFAQEGWEQLDFTHGSTLQGFGSAGVFIQVKS